MSTKECVMCFDDEGELMKVPCVTCRAWVHGECLVAWIIRRGSCPVCRESVMLNDAGAGGVPATALDRMLMADPNFVETVATVWESLTDMSNTRQFILQIFIMVANLFLPFLFFLMDVACGVMAMGQVEMHGSISPHLCSIMVSTLVMHFLVFALQLISLENNKRWVRILSFLGLVTVLITPFWLREEFQYMNMSSAGNKISASNTNLANLANFANGMSNVMNSANPGNGMSNVMSTGTNVMQWGYFGMTYLIMFLMTIPAMFHPRAIWRVNYLCERVTFLCIVCGLRHANDTRILLALTSFTAILTSGVTLTL
jgi:hypothetical protein